MKYVQTLYKLKGPISLCKRGTIKLATLSFFTIMPFRTKPNEVLLRFVLENYLNEKGMGFGEGNNSLIDHGVHATKVGRIFLWRDLLSDLTGIKWDDVLINLPISYK